MTPTSKKVLVVEDDGDQQDLVLRAVGQSKSQVALSVAHDGEEALEFLLGQGRHADRQDAPPPDLVLLDLSLPKIGGLEVLKRIRSSKKLRFMPVVILTSSSEDRDVNGGFAGGANSYVLKPVDFVEFCKVIDHVLTYWLHVNVDPRNA